MGIIETIIIIFSLSTLLILGSVLSAGFIIGIACLATVIIDYIFNFFDSRF